MNNKKAKNPRILKMPQPRRQRTQGVAHAKAQAQAQTQQQQQQVQPQQTEQLVIVCNLFDQKKQKTKEFMQKQMETLVDHLYAKFWVQLSNEFGEMAKVVCDYQLMVEQNQQYSQNMLLQQQQQATAKQHQPSNKQPQQQQHLAFTQPVPQFPPPNISIQPRMPSEATIAQAQSPFASHINSHTTIVPSTSTAPISSQLPNTATVFHMPNQNQPMPRRTFPPPHPPPSNSQQQILFHNYPGGHLSNAQFASQINSPRFMTPSPMYQPQSMSSPIRPMVISSPGSAPKNIMNPNEAMFNRIATSPNNNTNNNNNNNNLYSYPISRPSSCSSSGSSSTIMSSNSCLSPIAPVLSNQVPPLVPLSSPSTITSHHHPIHQLNQSPILSNQLQHQQQHQQQQPQMPPRPPNDSSPLIISYYQGGLPLAAPQSPATSQRHQMTPHSPSTATQLRSSQQVGQQNLLPNRIPSNNPQDPIGKVSITVIPKPANHINPKYAQSHIQTHNQPENLENSLPIDNNATARFEPWQRVQLPKPDNPDTPKQTDEPTTLPVVSSSNQVLAKKHKNSSSTSNNLAQTTAETQELPETLNELSPNQTESIIANADDNTNDDAGEPEENEDQLDANEQIEPIEEDYNSEQSENNAQDNEQQDEPEDDTNSEYHEQPQVDDDQPLPSTSNHENQLENHQNQPKPGTSRQNDLNENLLAVGENSGIIPPTEQGADAEDDDDCDCPECTRDKLIRDNTIHNVANSTVTLGSKQPNLKRTAHIKQEVESEAESEDSIQFIADLGMPKKKPNIKLEEEDEGETTSQITDRPLKRLKTANETAIRQNVVAPAKSQIKVKLEIESEQEEDDDEGGEDGEDGENEEVEENSSEATQLNESGEDNFIDDDMDNSNELTKEVDRIVQDLHSQDELDEQDENEQEEEEQEEEENIESQNSAPMNNENIQSTNDPTSSNDLSRSLSNESTSSYPSSNGLQSMFDYPAEVPNSAQSKRRLSQSTTGSSTASDLLTTELFTTQAIKCVDDNCGAMLTTKEEIAKHQLDVHSIQQFQCKVAACGLSFSTRNRLKSHLAELHAEERDWTCRYCGAQSQNHTRLDQHIRFHHMKGEFKCNTANCDFVGDFLAGITQHNQIVHNNMET